MEKKSKIAIGVTIAIVVILAVVIPCAILLPPSNESTDTTEPPSGKPAFNFDDIWGEKYSYKSIYPQWDKSTPSVQTDYITTSDGALVRKDVNKPEYTEEIIDATTIENLGGSYYSISANGKFAAFRLNYQKVWRHSYTADFKILDIEDKKEVLFKLPTNIQHLEWAPVGHRLAYVQDFTVYMVNDVGGDTAGVTVSPKGEKNMKYYGIPDWMYEEEMISSNNVLYWNPSGTRIAYLETTEENVQHIQYTWYGDAQYPETIDIAYPKAGTQIGKATLWAYNVEEGTNTVLPAPSQWTEANTDFYFSRFTWRDNDICLATWTNRPQTISRGQLCMPTMNGTEEIFECENKATSTENTEGDGWVGSFGPFYPVWRSNTNKNDYFTIYTRDQGSDGFWQIAYVSEDDDEVMWMTNTSYDIVELNYFDGTNGYLYFTAAHNLPRRRHILRISADDRHQQNPDCMTCDLIDKYPDRCGWISPVFTDDGSMVVLNCRGNMVPITLLVSTSSNDWAENSKVLENNAALENEINQVKWPKRYFDTFESNEYEKAYNYEIWYPEDYDESAESRYALLIEVYAGPEFQKVTDTWRKGFAQTYMVSAREIIVASVDGRGSAYEGYKFMRQTYKKLGQYEPVDQTDFANYLISKHPSIDSSKVAIWGWSYGGYVTSHTLGYDAGNTFKCGIAVAPLADWTWYDAMYAERYMGQPPDNPEGYEKASIIRAHDLANFKNSSYVLIHGTADDNVHFQSAAEMEKALVEADVDFDNFFYADEAHSINSDETVNKHIYRQIDLRLSYCLGLIDKPYGDPN